MSRDYKKSNRVDEVDLKTIIDQHKLNYILTAGLSGVASKRLVKHSPSGTSYTSNQTIKVVIGSGSSYVDGSKSFIEVDLKSSEADTFGSGSCANIISSISMKTASGVELFNIQDVNVLSYLRDTYMRKNSREYFVGEGMTKGYTVSGDVSEIKATADASGASAAAPVAFTQLTKQTYGAALNAATNTFIIPLGDLMGFFSTNKLVPPQLISGSTIEFTLASDAIAMVSGAAGVFTVSKFDVYMYQMVLKPELFKELQSHSIKNGTQFSWVNHDVATVNDTVANLQIRYENSRARLKDAIIHIRTNAQLGSTADTMPGVAYPYTASTPQINLGSLYIPNQAVSSWAVAMKLTKDTFQTNSEVVDPNVYKNTNHTLAISLQSDDAVDMSGYASSSSQALVFKGSMSSFARDCKMFIRYYSIATAWGHDRVVVRE